MPFNYTGASVGTTSAVLGFEFTGGDSAYSNHRPLRLTINGTSYNKRVFDSVDIGGSDSHWLIRVTGLSPDTTYTFEAQLGYYSTNTTISWLSLYADGEFTTDPEVPAVEKWSWTSSNGSATATQTKNAYAILRGTRTADDFSYKVWNDLVDKIVEVRESRGFEWSNGYATLARTKAAAGDELTAKRFNSIWHNIQHLKGTGLDDYAPVEVGDEILGFFITTLTDTINAIIDGL